MHATISAQPTRIREALTDFAARLRAEAGPRIEALRLFGSRARGDERPDSDIDVCVLADEDTVELRRTVYDVAAAVGVEHGVLLAASIHDRASYDQLRRHGRRIVAEIERDGVPL